MKLLIVINSLILAGAEVLVAELVPLLEERGISVSVALLRWLGSPLEQRLQQRRTSFLEMPSNRIYSPLHILGVRRALDEFDIIHTQLFPAQLWVALAHGRHERPLLVTTEQNTENNRRKWWLRRLDLYMYRCYDHIACNSEATRAALFTWLPELETPSSVLPNGVPVRRFADAAPLKRSEIGIPDGVPLLISVARMQPQKDHATLLRAFSQVDPSAQLLLLGDGELRQSLEGLASALGVRERTHFLGRRADVASLLKTADVFVHATHSDGFCIAAAEALAAGLPVVTTGVPGVAEVVRDAGLQVPANDPQAMARAISELLGSPERRRALALAGRRRVQEFDMNKIADAHVALYWQLLRSAPP